jgi:hypothetical protein
MLCSSGYGSYWTAANKTGVNYNSTIKNEYRWHIIEDFLKKPQADLLAKMSHEGVKYIIATEGDSDVLAKACVDMPQHLRISPGTKWIFEIMP